MFNYLTVEEQATEWGVTPRHIQHLCREGKVEGAVKRGGVWFIPDAAPNPAKYSKYSKTNDNPFRFIGTKKRVFESSIKLFTQRGYENVSVSDIADAAGIRQSAVYNHFKSKQTILNTIYDYYQYYHLHSRPSQEAIESLIQKGQTLEIITQGFIYDFSKEILEPMSDITRIIIQRAPTDRHASELFRTLILESAIDFVENGLVRAVELERIKPCNTHTVAVLISCVRLYALLWWMIDPPYEAHQKMLADERALYRLIASILEERHSSET